jgi:hypothetical protein
MAEMITANGGKLDITDADKAENDKALRLRLGKNSMPLI